MNKQNSNIRFAIVALLMLLVAALRVAITGSGEEVSPLANFTPVGAMALFGGAYFSRTRAFVFPILTLWLSDILLNRLVFYGEWVFFYQGFAWVYGAFALMVIVGHFIMKKKTAGNFLAATVASVLIHWILTDLGVWLGSSLYPQTVQGLWMCLVAAIPFELNFLAGTLIYGAAMFGAFEWMKLRMPALKATA